RCSLDAGFYKLAEKTADVIDARFGPNLDTRLLRAHVLHNLHRFQEAERIARDLVTERGTPADLAWLSDVLVEQGNLAEGIELLQRLANLKPGPETDSRIAHVRWLKGDLKGALTAMQTAREAADPRDFELTAWLDTRRAGLQLQDGNPRGALAS